MSRRYVPPGRATITRHVGRGDGITISQAPAMIEVELEYGDTPPSLNRIGTRGSRWATTSAKKMWQGVWESLLMQACVPRDLDAVTASASLRFPTRRERDEGNFRWMLEKALGDALTRGGWLPSDGADRFRFGRVDFEADRGPKRTTITLECRMPCAPAASQTKGAK